MSSINRCTFNWKLKKFSGLGAGDTASVSGSLSAPDIAPKTSGKLSVSLPKNWKDYDVLYITATDLYGRQLNIWSWPITTPDEMAERMQPKGTGTVSVKEDVGRLIMNANNIEVAIDLKTGLLLAAKNRKGTLSLKNGPVLISGEATTSAVTHADDSIGHVVKVSYQGAQRYQFSWTMMPSGILKLKYQYRPENNQEMLGVTFDYPEERVKGIQLMANGPYHVYKNRMKGTTFNSWTKTYNNAVTGEVWEYPEFKGYIVIFMQESFRLMRATFLFTQKVIIFFCTC